MSHWEDAVPYIWRVCFYTIVERGSGAYNTCLDFCWIFTLSFPRLTPLRLGLSFRGNLKKNSGTTLPPFTRMILGKNSQLPRIFYVGTGNGLRFWVLRKKPKQPPNTKPQNSPNTRQVKLHQNLIQTELSRNHQQIWQYDTHTDPYSDPGSLCYSLCFTKLIRNLLIDFH